MKRTMLLCAIASFACMGAQDFTGVYPESVKTIGLVAMSSVMPQKKLVEGTNLLAKAGFKVKVMPNVPKRTVEPPEVRARLFEQAWMDPEVDLLLFATGGQGAIDVVNIIDWDKLRSRDMRVIGFSDLTLLVNTMLAKKAGHPYSGPVLTTMLYSTKATLKRIHDALAGTPPSAKLTPVKPVSAPVKGTAMGGLLDRIRRMAESGTLPDTAGKVVFIECTSKYKDRSEEVLGQLVEKGVFSNAAGVVICSFNDSNPKSRMPKKEVAALLERFAAKVPCPVFKGFPYGHVSETSLIDFRRELTISPDGLLEWSKEDKGWR